MKKTEESRSSRYKKWKFLTAFVSIMALFSVVRHAFSIEVPLQMNNRTLAQREKIGADDDKETMEETVWKTERDEQTTAQSPSIEEDEEEAMNVDGMDDIELPDENLLYSQQAESVVLDNGQGEHRIKGVWSYVECFPDIQDVQIVAAQKYGITPVKNRTEAESLVKRHQLVNISHSPFYAIDQLTHSIPYLVPRAQHLLNTICLNFIDSCHVKGLPIHLPIVTSVLRTTDDVSNLQRGNKNATTNSCHCYGTTVDIAYNKFMPMTGTYNPQAALLRWNEPMKQVLSEVLNDLRRQNRCYVKYERKQGCFHLTCR